MAGRQFFLFKGYAVALKVVGRLRSLSYVLAVNQMIGASFGIAIFMLAMLGSAWLSTYPVPVDLLLGLLVGDLIFIVVLTGALYFFTRERRLVSALGVDNVLLKLAQTPLPFEAAVEDSQLAESGPQPGMESEVELRLDRMEKLLLALAEDQRERHRAASTSAAADKEIYSRTGSGGS